MSEEEKMNLLTFFKSEMKHLNDNIESIKDFIDVKYATKTELTEAKERRDTFCEAKEAKLDKKFTPVYGMLIIIILFLTSVHGTAILEFITKFI
jgi:wobble nucleotide-excising tRNase